MKLYEAVTLIAGGLLVVWVGYGAFCLNLTLNHPHLNPCQKFQVLRFVSMKK